MASAWAACSEDGRTTALVVVRDEGWVTASRPAHAWGLRPWTPVGAPSEGWVRSGNPNGSARQLRFLSERRVEAAVTYGLVLELFFVLCFFALVAHVRQFAFGAAAGLSVEA